MAPMLGDAGARIRNIDKTPVAVMAASRRNPSSFSDYGLRQDSNARWQLIEPLATDKHALEAELQRLNAKISSLEDESDTELMLGSEILSERKRVQEEQAQYRFTRVYESLAMLYTHECEQVNARYAERCEQLKQDMSEELQREIRRLKQTREGVSVMDRRRLTRHSGGGNGSSGSGGGNGSNSSNFTHPSGSTGLGLSSSSQLFGGNGDDSGLHKDPYYSAVSTTAAQLAEKKRMEVLLSATPIFRRLNKTLAEDQVADDLALIKHTMPSLIMAAPDARGNGEEEESDDEEQERRELAVARRQMNHGADNVFKKRRLHYDPESSLEGTSVVVLRPVLSSSPSSSTTSSTAARKKNKTKSKTKKQKQEQLPVKDSDDHANRSLSGHEMSTGVVTALSKTQLFLLTADGLFETIEISDWQSGRVSVIQIAP